MADRTIKLILEFDGTDFHGWQIQSKQRTVQGELDHAIREGLGDARPGLTGCSRTDAGVHARRFCASFVTACPFPITGIAGILNGCIGNDIAVLAAEEAAESFNARFDVTSKHYRYTIRNRPEPSPLARRWAWRFGRPLDTERMQAAAAHLVGTHDFTAFCGRTDASKSPVLTIDAVTIGREGDLVTIDVRGRSFLFRMVRIMAGTLADAGCGRISPEDVEAILASRNKNRARRAAPACGLCLMEVNYDPHPTLSRDGRGPVALNG